MAKVLIFDDDHDILELCSIILRSKGYETYGNLSCRDLLQKIKAVNPDVILMDNWIPDEGGVEATQQIKNNAATRHIPVIFFSASNEVKEYAEKAHADYYLRKPFDIADLQQMISKALQGSEKKISDN